MSLGFDIGFFFYPFSLLSFFFFGFRWIWLDCSALGWIGGMAWPWLCWIALVQYQSHP